MNKNSNKEFKIAFLLFAICTFFFTNNTVYSQGKIPIKKTSNSFLGAIEFIPNSELAKGLYIVKTDGANNPDDLANRLHWHKEGNSSVRGMLREAVLFFEWWVKGEEPVTRYKFDWVRSSYFEVMYNDDKGNLVVKNIDRNDLKKYPNLLKRFDNISPQSIEFEYSFRFGDLPDKEYYQFRARHNILEDLGSAGYTVTYTKILNGGFILYKGKGKSEWTQPGLILGGWNEFLNFPEKLNDKKSKLLEIIKMSREVSFSSAKIKSIKWPINEFVYIAQKLKDYEEGKDEPSAFDEVANTATKSKSGDGIWDEADLLDTETEVFYDNEKRLYGIKTKKGRIIKEPFYDNIVKSKTQPYFLAQKGNTAYSLSNFGNVLEIKGYSKSFYISACENGKLVASIPDGREEVEKYSYEYEMRNNHLFDNGKFSSAKKTYIGNRKNYILVRREGEREPSKEEKEVYENMRSEAIKAKRKSLESRGYTGINVCD